VPTFFSMGVFDFTNRVHLVMMTTAVSLNL